MQNISLKINDQLDLSKLSKITVLMVVLEIIMLLARNRNARIKESPSLMIIGLKFGLLGDIESCIIRKKDIRLFGMRMGILNRNFLGEG
jgi:hypothetical protein